MRRLFRKTAASIAACAVFAASAAPAFAQSNPFEEALKKAGEELLKEALREAGVEIPEDGEGEPPLIISDEPIGAAPEFIEGYRGPVADQLIATRGKEIEEEIERNKPVLPDENGECPPGYMPIFKEEDPATGDIVMLRPKDLVLVEEDLRAPAGFQPVLPKAAQFSFVEGATRAALASKALQRAQLQPMVAATPTPAPSPTVELKASQIKIQPHVVTGAISTTKTPAPTPSPTPTLAPKTLTMQAGAITAMKLDPELRTELISKALTEYRAKPAEGATPSLVASPALQAKLAALPKGETPMLTRLSSDLKIDGKVINKYTPLVEVDNLALADRKPNACSRSIFMQTIPRNLLWPTDEPVTVAFLGGTTAARAAIMEAALKWVDDAELEMSFGRETPEGFVFNEWSAADAVYKADIRISFEPSWGYWSVVGKEAADPARVKPNQPSMNLAGFDGTRPLPADWRRFVYHEFGHALGLFHEHQHPTHECGDALRLDDDPGYQLTLDANGRAVADGSGRRPGLVTILGQAPNYWPAEHARFNLGPQALQAFMVVFEYDPYSIMKYEFPASFYRDDAPPSCLPSGSLAMEPTTEDLDAIARVYQAFSFGPLDE